MMSRMAGTNPSRCQLCEADRKAAFAVAARRRIKPVRTRAMTLLETMMAMSLMTVISVIGAQTVRITWQAWDMQARRSDTLQHLSGTLTHITRHLRAARNVVEVSGPTNDDGFLAITLPDDSVVKWNHDGITGRIYYGIDPPTSLLAQDIDTLTFECFEIDGVTPTTITTDIRMIRITSSVTVTGQSVPLSATVWIRKQRDVLAAPYDDFYATNSSTPIGWNNHTYTIGPPDGLLSYGGQGATIRAFGFDSTGYTGAVGTVLVGFLLKTDSNMDDDFLDVQIDRGLLGPIHSFEGRTLMRFINNLDWFWVDVTDDFAGWLYEDLSATRVQITNRDAGTIGATVYLDSVKIRTFVTAPVTQTFWMTGLGSGTNKWHNQLLAVGAPNATYAKSHSHGTCDDQSYSYPGSWEDLGAIVRVRLLLDLYVSATLMDDEYRARLVLTANPLDQHELDVPITSLNQHVGVASQGVVYLDFSNHETWTWPGVDSRDVRFHFSETGASDGDIYVDGVGLEVRYVPLIEPAVVLWEEL